jgi:hypothetical protein
MGLFNSNTTVTDTIWKQGMAYLFDEQKLRASLSAMTEDEREQHVIGFIKLVTMPRNHKRLLVGENNRDLDTAVISVADVIAYASSYQRSQLETPDFQAYIGKLEHYHD